MCELQWDPLAVVNFQIVDNPVQFSCLCSRVFTRSKDDKAKQQFPLADELSASENEAFRDDDITELPSEHIDNSQNTSIDIKQDADAEVVSCYCSASHTDNISTDEHDSLRDSQINRPSLHKGLQSSDSGADLTEHLKSDLEAAWHKFWADHGERLIWDSWISKYSDYINSDYLTNCDDSNEDADETKDLIDGGVSKLEHSKTKFSFEKKDLEKVESGLSIIEENKVLTKSEEYKAQDVAFKNRILVRNLSGSDSYDKLNTDISEGWNPLSPLSVDCETEAERLLSSRCGSYASSSVRTVDSMTNVTRMTVSSIDLSESSKNSDSFSSVSSVQSSLSSTSSEDYDENADYDTQWNLLWKKHYEDEYLEQYRKFSTTHSDKLEEFETAPLLTHRNVVQSMKVLGIERKNSNNSSIDESESCKKGTKHKRVTRKTLESVGYLMQSLKMDDTSETELPVLERKRCKKSTSKSNSIEDSSMHLEDEEESLMSSMGLPTNFGKKKMEKEPTKSGSSFDSDQSDQSTSDRIKSAFNLMGIVMNETNEMKIRGCVDYKMKHIRLQNRQLKLLYNPNSVVNKPKHIFFDDDCNEIHEDREEYDEVIFQGSLTDTSENKQSSSSNEDEPESIKLPPPPMTTDDCINCTDKEIPVQEVSRKRKRKRKLALPPEIKENPKLRKYWQRRFSLFSKFDLGIKLDEESWYSVTPETVAIHTAQRCQSDVIVDAFCGAGGNSIQFANTCKRVIAIDVDPKKIELAKNNAKVYGVEDKIEFILGDFFKLADGLKADAVFLSPPWGGPAYLNQKSYDLETMLQPVPLHELISAARQITENIALFLPKNSNTFPLLVSSGPGKSVEIEQNFINKKLIAITAYYNDLIKQL